MTRKPLPKAIRRPIDNLRGIAAEFVADEQGRVPRQKASDGPVFDAVEPEPAAAVAAPHAAPSPSAERQHRDAHAAKRRALAKKIIDRHRNYAALGGLVPLPVVSIASLTAINMRMVQALSKLYSVPFQRDRTRSLIVGIVGGAVPAGLGTAASSTLMFVIPGGLLVGIGVSAISAAALTRGIGMVFVEGFESGTTA
jgi:uncharacterized protein (DUF697 family)